MKSLSFKCKITRGADAGRYQMPALKDDCLVGRSSDHAEREAYERGFRAGEQAGFEMGGQKAKVVLEKLEALLRDAASVREGLAKGAEVACIQIAVALAKKIITKEIQANPKEIVSLVREALTRVERSGQVTIRIHPQLQELFATYRPELLQVHQDIVFDVDPAVPQFGAVVMGPSEDVVVEINEQLKNLIKDMVTRRGGS